MSTHFLDEPAPDGNEPERESDPSSSEDEDEDLTWEDWVSDSAAKRLCKSLFDETTLTSVAEILEWDKLNHGVDLEATAIRLCTSPTSLVMLSRSYWLLVAALDYYKRIRLINWVRKEVCTLTG